MCFDVKVMKKISAKQSKGKFIVVLSETPDLHSIVYADMDTSLLVTIVPEAGANQSYLEATAAEKEAKVFAARNKLAYRGIVTC